MSPLVDSHCHLDFPELASRLPEVMAGMARQGVGYTLCVGVTMSHFPRVLEVARIHPHVFASVGVHPDHQEEQEPSIGCLVESADHPKVVAIGETGLDYFRLRGDMAWQKERFRTHIRAARECGKPLIVHCREAAADTLDILEQENAREVGGVMHCFTESWETAQRAMELSFYISFSGIVTFKNAAAVKEVAKLVPAERLLVETDSPYLAPTPHRGKTNEPAYVRHVAEEIGRLRGIPLEEVAETTTRNFFQLFTVAHP